MAKLLPCVSPHNGAREELPQAYVVSGLSASHSALPWFWAGTALVLGGHCLGFGRALPWFRRALPGLERALHRFEAGRRFPKLCGDGLTR